MFSTSGFMRNIIQRWLCTSWFILLCGSTLLGQNPAVVSQLNDARTTLEEWVRTETMISKEASEWQVQKRVLEDIADVAERELKILEEGIAKIRANQTAGEQAKDLLLQRRHELDQMVQRLETYLPPLEAKLLEQIKFFPEPLLDSVALQASRIPQPGVTLTDKMPSFVVRAQNIAVILRQADLFNSKITLDKPRLQLPNTKDKVYNVLYFGLGAAYFVDESGDIGGIGQPGPNGWTWIRNDEIAPDVQNAILIFESKSPARFVNLPFQLDSSSASAK